jgi:hypothetical protein
LLCGFGSPSARAETGLAAEEEVGREDAGPPSPFRCPEYALLAPELARHPQLLRSRLLTPNTPLSDDCRALQIHLAMLLGEWSLADAQIQTHLANYPQDAGAWLDLAIARLRQGDREGAQELLVLVESRFPPPAPIQRLIDQLREEAIAQPAAQPPRRFWSTHLQSFSFLLVRDSNANMGLANNNLDLTLGDQSLTLPVARDNLPRAAWAAQAQYLAAGNIGVWHDLPTAATQDLPPLEWLILVRQKNYRGESYYDNRQIQFNLAQPLQSGDRGFILRGRLEEDWLDRDNDIFSAKAGMVYQRPLDSCQMMLNADYEIRRHKRSELLDGNIFWWGGEVGCPLPVWPDARLQGWFRHGRDYTRSDRAWGDTNYIDAGVHLRKSFSPRWQADFTWQVSHAEDRHGYSPILKNGATRRIRREVGSFALKYRVDPALSVSLQITNYAQNSNLSLFEARNRSVSLGITYDW